MEKIICSKCGRVIENELYKEVDGEVLCMDCFNEDYIICDDCGKVVRIDESHYVEGDDKHVCEDCINDFYTLCEDCGYYHENDVMTYVENFGYVCDDCLYNGNYGQCSHCDCWYENDEINYSERYDEYYCNDCYDDVCGDDLLYSYHSFNDWHLFKGQNEENAPYYIGKEIELEPKRYNEGLKQVVDNMNKYLNAVGMEDGSLNSGGIEVVTHPESWKYLQENKENYKKFFEEINKLGYGDGGNAGLHFHVTRPNENVITRIIVILESFKDEIKKLSRRNGDFHWSRFISDNSNESEVEKIKYRSQKYLKDKYLNQYHDRYSALNLTNEKTIEFRFFNGANNFEEYWSALQFIHNIMEVALNEKIDLNTITWKSLIDGIELEEQAKKQDVYNIEKHVKETSEIVEKLENTKENLKKEIKRTLKNFIKYISKEMENKKLDIANKNDVNEIKRISREFLEKLDRDLSYLESVTNVYNYVDDNSITTTKNRIEDLKYWTQNRTYYSRYFKQIEKSFEKYNKESEDLI